VLANVYPLAFNAIAQGPPFYFKKLWVVQPLEAIAVLHGFTEWPSQAHRFMDDACRI
jgi:hypothetical protein